MDIKNSVLDYLRYKQLNWYGHVRRINEERLSRKMLEWCPPVRRRKGRPRNSWMQEVIIGMIEKGNNSMQWIDREEWGRKIKLILQAQKYVKTLILCAHTHKHTHNTHTHTHTHTHTYMYIYRPISKWIP